MIKAIGFSAGEFGDIILNSTLCRTFKENYPNSFLTLAVNKKYSNVFPLFYNNEYVDGFRIYQGYDDWPINSDLDFLKTQDIVFNAMPQHKDNLWYKKPGGHNISEIHDMHGFPEPKNKQCHLNRWFDLLPNYDKTITASVFPSGNHPDQLARTFNPSRLYKLFNEIELETGYNIIRLDTRMEPEIEHRWPASKLPLIEAARILCSSRLHLTCDTSWSWIADGYSHNTIGWTRLPAYVPVNPQGYYFVNNIIESIPLESILELIRKKL